MSYPACIGDAAQWRCVTRASNDTTVPLDWRRTTNTSLHNSALIAVSALVIGHDAQVNVMDAQRVEAT